MNVTCARCGAFEADSDTALFKGWEHDIRDAAEAVSRARGGDPLAWVCPDCLTPFEKQTIEAEIQEKMVANERTLVTTPETCARCSSVRTWDGGPEMVWINAEPMCLGCLTSEERAGVETRSKLDG